MVEQNSPLLIEKVRLPEELKAGQVLVKVYYSGVCGSQIGEITGVKGPDPFLPHLLGHEGTGEVLEIGPGVRYVRPGDHVVMHWRKGNGIEAETPTYSWNGKKLNAGSVTTFNEFAIVSENRLTPIPLNFDMRIATLFGCAVTTGLGVIINNAKLKLGESIIVFGAGGVGLNIIQGAAMTSAYPIMAVDLYDNKLEMAIKMGATHTINSRVSDPGEKIAEILNNAGADIVVDNTGIPEVTALACRLTGPNGKTVLVGVPRKGDNLSIYTLPLFFGKTITGSHGGESQPSIDIPKYIGLFKVGKLILDDLITDQFNLENINEAIEKMQKGMIAGRCVIKMP